MFLTSRKLAIRNRKLNVMFAKSASFTARISLSKTWIEDIAISPENRDVSVTYTDKKEVIIKKL